jgi:uncharacterized membrane protein SirB2
VAVSVCGIMRLRKETWWRLQNIGQWLADKLFFILLYIQ